MAKSLCGVVLVCLMSVGCAQHTDLVSPSGLAPAASALLDPTGPPLQRVTVYVSSYDPATQKTEALIGQRVTFISSVPNPAVYTTAPDGAASGWVPATDKWYEVWLTRDGYCPIERKLSSSQTETNLTMMKAQGCTGPTKQGRVRG